MTQYLLSVHMIEGVATPSPEAEIQQDLRRRRRLQRRDQGARRLGLRRRPAPGRHGDGRARQGRRRASRRTARSPRPRSSSAASGSSRPPTSTPRWRGRRRRPWPAAARSRCGRSRTSPRPERTCPSRPPSRSSDVFREESGQGRRDPGPPLRRHRHRRGGGPGGVRRGRRSAGRATGLPPNPGGWIVTTARNRAIDRLRRESSRYDRYVQAALLEPRDEEIEVDPMSDDRLRLIFTCCHPALAPGAQVALTLRLLGGLQTPEIARAFLVARADDGPAPRAREAQDPRRRTSRTASRRRRARRPAAPGARASST